MKKLLLASAIAAVSTVQVAQAEDIKIGVFLGFTGAIESIVADMGPGAELAISEVSASGKVVGRFYRNCGTR